MACNSVFRVYVLILFISLCVEIKTKTTESEELTDKVAEIKPQKVPEIKFQKVPEIKLQKVPEIKPQKFNDGAVLIFADEFKQTLERYLFGICPQTFRSRWAQMQLGLKGKAANSTAPACDVDADHQELAGRLATLSLRVHSASRVDCSRFGAALANTLADLARTAANRAEINSANNEAIKKRKLSKSQKAKLQAKQRTALAVKKKAAAVAAAAAAKMAS